MVLTNACWVLSDAVDKSNFFETKYFLGSERHVVSIKLLSASYSWHKFIGNSTKQLFAVFLLKYHITLYEVL